MLMRNWTPSSEVPTTSLDNPMISRRQETFLLWCKVIISALIFATLVSFCVVYILQKETFFNKEYQRKRDDQYNQQQRLLFDTYIQDISKILLQISAKNHTDEQFILYIQTKTLLLLKDLDVQRKNDIILFLYRTKLIQNNQLNLSGANLNNVELVCPHDLSYLHLSGIHWSNAIFINCHFIHATLDHAYFNNARFINSTLRYASFAGTNLDHSHFIGTIVMDTYFNGASLIQANFLQADIVQGNDFTNADLYRAELTDDQLEGKKISVLKHNFHHARFPNGSFELTNSEENLILNGNADTECSSNNQTIWTTISRNMTLLTDNIAMNNSYWGNCSFVVSAKIRAYQNINLHSYSLLIDTDNAAFSFFAFASCTQSVFEIHMYRSDGILHQERKYSFSEVMQSIEIYGNRSMYQYGEGQQQLPMRTRYVTIYFDVQSLDVNFPCYFDNITFTLHQTKMK